MLQDKARDKEPITHLQYWLNSYLKYNIPPKALLVLVCMKNKALGDVSHDKYSTRPLNTPPLGLSTRLLVL